MLFHVKMIVNIPQDMDPAKATALKAEEKTRFQELQRSGKWRHIWRIVGHYANISVFNVDSPTELHDLLMSLPLFPFMTVEIMPLCRHPSTLFEDDR